MLQPRAESLDITISKIKRNQILLPDFQRQFVWKVEEMVKLVASVLTKLPIGSILLLKSTNAQEYSCKPLGAKDAIPQEELPRGPVEFLLDGQQRMTVLANVFSDTIFRLTPQSKNLIAPNALKRRFFLALPKYDIHQSSDLFGLHNLVFPMQSPDTDEPNFLTQDIIPLIRTVPFTAKNDNEKCYNPYMLPLSKAMSELVPYCLNAEQEWFYIPLYLLIGDSPARLNDTTLIDIIAAIAKTILDNKRNALAELLDTGEAAKAKKYIETHLEQETYKTYFNEDCFQQSSADILSEFANVLEKQKKTWETNMLSYLKSCLTQINLSQISLEESQRARAIDIYENLNRGGVSLDIFDLIMARVAQKTTKPFYQRLEDCIAAGSNNGYPKDHISSLCVQNAYQAFIEKKAYHASENMQCYNSKKNEFSKAYLDGFLNVLTLICHRQSNSIEEFSTEQLKRQQKLRLTADQINDNCERCCKAIDRACFFFQARCGIRTMRDLNYTLMLPIVAFILDEDLYYNGTTGIQIFNLLEAWYWSSIFAGAYDKDQNQMMVNDLNHLLVNAKEILSEIKPNIGWLKERRNQILDVRRFSDLDFLVTSFAQYGDFPKTVIGNTICQFYLSAGYEDLVLSESSEPLLLTPFFELAASLQTHHVIPLGSVANIVASADKLRKDKRHYLNSPLNFMYITERANQKISSKSLAEYAQMLPVSAGLSGVGFSNLRVDAAATDEQRKSVLKGRYTALRQAVTSRINILLPNQNF